MDILSRNKSLNTYAGSFIFVCSLIFLTFFTCSVTHAGDAVIYIEGANLLVEEIDVVTYDLDIQPGKCPNKIRIDKGKGNDKDIAGFLPVAITRSDGFTDETIPESILLGSDIYGWVAPLDKKDRLADVAIPTESTLSCFDCVPFEPDGVLDLQVTFDLQDFKDMFGEVPDGECVELFLEVDGEVVASDWAIVRNKVGKKKTIIVNPPRFQIMAHEEVAGNNLSFPLIFSENIGLSGDPLEVNTGLRGNNVTESQFDGVYTTINEQNWYHQQDPLNEWQAGWAHDFNNPVNIDEIDWGDSLESTTWSETSYLRVEVTLYVDLTKMQWQSLGLQEYVMGWISGLGMDEMWGTNKELIDGSFATVYSSCARLIIEKLDDGESPLDPTYVVLNQPVSESYSIDGPSGFSAECNVKGKVIYGYNWKLRNEVFPADIEKYGWYRLTFTFDDQWANPTDVITNNSFITENTKIYVTPGEAVSALESEPSGYTPIIDEGNNATYIDIYIEESTGGGGKGGGGNDSRSVHGGHGGNGGNGQNS